MEKSKIETFIKKYSLNGLIEGVIWSNNNGSLSTSAMTSDRKLFSSVQLENAAGFIKNNAEIPIQNTTKLKRMLLPLSENVTLSLDLDEDDNTRVRQLIIDDERLKVDYVAAIKDVIDATPKMKKIPSFNVEINMNNDFIDAFSKSFSSLSDEQTLFTLIMNEKKQRLEMVLNYKQSNSDRISLTVDATDGKNIVKSPISFSAKHLKEILSVNKNEGDSKTVLQISEEGLASISFVENGFKSQYYLVKTEVED